MHRKRKGEQDTQTPSNKIVRIENDVKDNEVVIINTD